MNTLVVSFYNTRSYSRAIMLDQLQQALNTKKETDNIYLISCAQTFNTCYFNFKAEPSACYSCAANMNNCVKLVEGDFKHIKLLSLIKEEDRAIADKFFEGVQSISREVRFENCEIGEAAISSYISRTRDMDLALGSESDFLRTASYNTLLTYLAIKRFLKEKNISKVVNFNGRQDYVRSVLRASESLGIDCYNFEKARPGGYIEFFKNTLPHDIRTKVQMMEDNWNSSELPEEKKIEIGSSFFTRKRKGDTAVSRIFITDQVAKQLPEGIDFSKKTIVLYNSSDDEFAAVGDEYKNPFFENQNEGINYIVDLFGTKYPEYNLIIRMHPNLKKVKFSYATDVLKLHNKYPNIFVAGPNSTVDSYSLMDLAWKIITFGSSVGLEANFWGKPVVLLAKCRYFYSDIAYVPKDVRDIENLLEAELAPKNSINSVIHGFYYINGGTKSEYYNTEGFNDRHLFKGYPISERKLSQTVVIAAIKAADKLAKIKLNIKYRGTSFSKI